MKFTIHRAPILATLLVMSASIEAAGFRQIEVADAGHKDLTVGVWYPSRASVPAEPNTQFGLPVALDAPIDDANGGLILISHGYSGWYAGHADTAEALADAGYIVAAPSHTGNTWSDMSSSVDEWMVDRPRHISRVIDDLLEREGFKQAIDPSKIGVYGFSAGGYTALTLIGGVPDLQRASMHCQQQPEEFICKEGMVAAALGANPGQQPEIDWGADPRITAASIAAPGFGFAFSKESLAPVTAGVQLWSGQLDDSVPTASNAANIAAQLPTKPETHWVERANHFAFLILPCTREAFKREEPQEYAMVCNDADGFDRYQFHIEMHAEMLRFFNQRFLIN